MQTFSSHAAHQQTALRLLRAAGILPVVTVDSIDQARAVAVALQRGGLHSIELTLRTPVALGAIAVLKREFPDLASKMIRHTAVLDWNSRRIEAMVEPV